MPFKHSFSDCLKKVEMIVQIIFLFEENNVVMAFLEASHVTTGNRNKRQLTLHERGRKLKRERPMTLIHESY